MLYAIGIVICVLVLLFLIGLLLWLWPLGPSWAARHRLTGVLSEYPGGDGCYDWALARGRFQPTKPHHGSPDYVAGFSPSLHHINVVYGPAD